MIKITGGSLKGRSVNISETELLRPTTSFFREWIFNVLRNHVEIDESSVLDLFGGSGIISYEFLSRNAVSSTVVESDKKLIDKMKLNAERFGLKNISIIFSECERFLNHILSSGKTFPFNIIFLDPPYSDIEITDKILDTLFKAKLKLPGDVTIVCETSKDYELKIDNNFAIINLKKSGTSKMTVIRRIN